MGSEYYFVLSLVTLAVCYSASRALKIWKIKFLQKKQFFTCARNLRLDFLEDDRTHLSDCDQRSIVNP
jgi:hypothetical protein